MGEQTQGNDEFVLSFQILTDRQEMALVRPLNDAPDRPIRSTQSEEQKRSPAHQQGAAMINKFLTLGKIPELRSEPQGSEEENPVPELELALRIEQYWEMIHWLRELRFATSSGQSTLPAWRRIRAIANKCIVNERDRIWFMKNNQKTGTAKQA
jgi:hypothetical protein